MGFAILNAARELSDSLFLVSARLIIDSEVKTHIYSIGGVHNSATQISVLFGSGWFRVFQAGYHSPYYSLSNPAQVIKIYPPQKIQSIARQHYDPTLDVARALVPALQRSPPDQSACGEAALCRVRPTICVIRMSLKPYGVAPLAKPRPR